MLRPDIIPVLQTAIGPVILISGVGLLLLTMTNRIARAVDRARALLARGTVDGKPQTQLRVLLKRTKILQQAIFLVTSSALCAALLVVTIFLSPFVRMSTGWLVSVLFVGAMAALILALVQFMRDVALSLKALEADVPDDLRHV